MKNIYIILFLLLFLIIIIFISVFYFHLENYINENNLDIYVISLKTPDRLENIKKQSEKIHKNINIFDATRGDKLDIDDLIKKGIVSDIYKDSDIVKKREIGCYMSHIMLYNKIKELEHPGYTLILEDDFVVKSDNLMDEINIIIDKLKNMNKDFDMLYLGNFRSVYGEHIIDNVYYNDKTQQLLCTHAYIVNNNSINKVINLTNKINKPIDHVLDELSKTNQLTIMVLYPTIIDQGGAGTIINDKSIELLTNISKNYSNY